MAFRFHTFWNLSVEVKKTLGIQINFLRSCQVHKRRNHFVGPYLWLTGFAQVSNAFFVRDCWSKADSCKSWLDDNQPFCIETLVCRDYTVPIFSPSHPQKQVDGLSPGSCSLKLLVISNTVAFMPAFGSHSPNTQSYG